MLPFMTKDTVTFMTKGTVTLMTEDTVTFTTKETVTSVTKETVTFVIKETVTSVTKETVTFVIKETVTSVTKGTVKEIAKGLLLLEKAFGVMEKILSMKVRIRAVKVFFFFIALYGYETRRIRIGSRNKICGAEMQFYKEC